MAIVEISASGGKLPRFKPDVLQQLIQRISTQATELAVEEVQTSIQRVNAVASGQLLESITARNIGRSSRDILIAVGSDDRAVASIEEGLKPGVPVTVDRIYEWMVQKNLPEPSRWGAYYIARKLFNEGYTARKPFEQAEENLAPKIDQLIVDILNSEDFS